MKIQFGYAGLTRMMRLVPKHILRAVDWNKAKGFYSKKIKILLILCTAFLLPTTLNAEPIKPNITNIGFMKNPPQKLKNKFPMCDAFLKVTWIDKKKRVGYSKYNIYNGDGKKYKSDYFVLIYLSEYFPTDYLDIKKWQKKADLKKLSSFIREGNIVPDIGTFSLIIKTKQGKEIKLEHIHIDYPLNSNSYANRLLNICIPYPDNQRMWIAEMKDPEKIYSKQELSEINKRVSAWVSDFSFRKQYAIFDFNFDGTDDYFGIPTVMSNGMRYFETLKPMWEGETDNNRGKFYMTQTKKVCDTIAWSVYLTTDGASYFFNNICNLTTGK